MLDDVLFVVFPYLTFITAVWVGIYRFRNDRFSYSTQSSQFLENRMLSWGSAPWHYAILTILTAHFVALLVPSIWASAISAPIRLYILEVTGLSLALVAVFALCVLVYRRLTTATVRSVTTPADWLLLALLLTQVALGFWVALFFRWGADWYLHTTVPWGRLPREVPARRRNRHDASVGGQTPHPRRVRHYRRVSVHTPRARCDLAHQLPVEAAPGGDLEQEVDPHLG
jgi:Nitrate reductase gamma subunit